jgi:2-polyprenyl-3-methyl-5-hydroxy-6-metoxy-1,4-benzoquinol methylase
VSERDVYTHGHQEAVLRSHRQRTAANSAAYLLPALGPGLSLLDVGCGPGTLTADLATWVAPGPVMGVDMSPDVVAEARERARSDGAENLTFVVGDFRELELEQAPFDIVHAHQVLQHLRDPIGALAAMRGLANPGGIVAARDSIYSSFAWSPDNDQLERWLAIYLAVTARNGADADAGKRLAAWARAAGFDDVTYTTSTWTFATAENRAWWGALWAERIVGSSLAAQAVEYEIASTDELAAVADGWRAWAAHPDATFVVVHGEIVARA